MNADEARFKSEVVRKANLDKALNALLDHFQDLLNIAVSKGDNQVYISCYESLLDAFTEELLKRGFTIPVFGEAYSTRTGPRQYNLRIIW